MKAQLSVDETRDMLLYVAGKMQESTEMLTHADQAIGDGDHGVGMARGFEAVQKKLEGQAFGSLQELFKATGNALLGSIGGAAGVIFATLFRGGAKDLGEEQVFDAKALSVLLRGGLRDIKERGKAVVGDKTMVDALEPAALKSEEVITLPLDKALAMAADEAEAGMERTKGIVATVGKARSLGERSIGHADPGALSTYLILKFMAEYVRQG
jgi:phosphoenolpyruvate---glycerone phosphotransferase subunit DhaL